MLQILREVLATAGCAGNMLDRVELKELVTGSSNENRMYSPKFNLIVDTAIARALQHNAEDCVRLSSTRVLLWEALLTSLQPDPELEFVEVDTLMTLIYTRSPLQWPSGGFPANFASRYVPAVLQMQVRLDCLKIPIVLH